MSTMSTSDELMNERVYQMLRRDIITASEPYATLALDEVHIDCLRYMVLDFLGLLRNRLSISGLTYLNLISIRNNDLAMYGERLTSYLNRAKGVLGLHEDDLRDYELLLRKYLTLIPSDLQQFRNKLVAIRAEQLQKSHFLIDLDDQVKCQIDYKLVIYQDVYVTPSTMPGTAKQQLDHFIEQIRQPESARANLYQLVDLLNSALQSSELAEFGPKLLPFGSLLTGLATFSSDLDVVIKFERLDVDVIDFDTAMLALEVIRSILNAKLGLVIGQNLIFASRRCPIVALKFEQCLPPEACRNLTSSNLRFNRCDISIRQLYSYYNSKLLEFLVKYDHRFYEMAIILKWWMKDRGLIDNQLISTFGLYMMITFLLQQTSPPILPTIGRLQELAKLQPGKAPIEVHQYNFAFCDDITIVGRSNNATETKDLLIAFISFYKNYDYKQLVVSPRTGKSLIKAEIFAKYQPQNLSDTSSVFKRTFIAIEDPFVGDNNCGGVFHSIPMSRWTDAFAEASYKIQKDPNNIIKILTTPMPIRPE